MTEGVGTFPHSLPPVILKPGSVILQLDRLDCEAGRACTKYKAINDKFYLVLIDAQRLMVLESERGGEQKLEHPASMDILVILHSTQAPRPGPDQIALQPSPTDPGERPQRLSSSIQHIKSNQQSNLQLDLLQNTLFRLHFCIILSQLEAF